MKTLTTLALSAVLASTLAHAAAPVTKPEVVSTTKVEAAASKKGSTPKALHGTWKSVNAEGGAMSGVIELRPDGKAMLAPQGEIRLEGNWRVENKVLLLEMPPYGTSQVQYVVNAKGLTLTYDNGVKQQFIQSTAKK